MPDRRTPQSAKKADPLSRIGVVDIGSNTLRLVVYDVPDRMPVPMFNEKSECRLAEGLAESGELSKPGVEKAFQSLRRFVTLSHAMGVETLDLVATAAVREARDGEDFVNRIETEFGIKVLVLSGAEEAELSALGLIVGVPEADGILGDLGGGSLDIVDLEHGKQTTYGTMPLGHLRLREMSDGKIRNARGIIAKHFKEAAWIAGKPGRNLYLVGGTMRALARVFIEQTGYPLHVVDNFTLRQSDALRLSRLLAGLSTNTLKKIPSISPNRVKSIPFAAEVLSHMIETAKPAQVVFSGFGMREGQMLKRLPEKMRHQDPLIAGAETLSERTGRFSLGGREVANWLKPLFPKSTIEDDRRILAACMLSDIGWSEHPDYRAEHAFYRCLRLPYAGLSHADRVSIAAMVYVRYNGNPTAPLIADLRGLLAPEQLDKVDGVGRAIRLAHTLSGSAPGLLSQTRLERKAKTVVLHLPGDTSAFESETVERRFRGLSKSLGLRGQVSVK